MNKNNENHIDRKEIKRNARHLLKSNWKVITGTLILSFALLCGFVAICNELSDMLVATLILLLASPITAMYYKFFIEVIENDKFTFKSLKPNLKSCFAIFKLIMFLIGICVFIALLISGIGYFLIKNNIIEINQSTVIIGLIGYIIAEIVMIIINIFITVCFAFTYMYIIDKNINGKIGIIKGVKNSYKLMKGYRLKYVEIALSFIGYWIILIIPNVIFETVTKDLEATLPLFIGLLVIIIWDVLGALFLSTYFMVCKTLLYKELRKRFESTML